MDPSSLFQVQFYLQLLIQMYNIKSIFVDTKLTAHYNTKRSVSWIVISGDQQIIIFSLLGKSVITNQFLFCKNCHLKCKNTKIAQLMMTLSSTK